MVTSKDVAALAGVSQATVSYVMNGTRPISEKTKKKVRAAIKQLGYYPNANARALAGQHAGVIAAVVRMNESTQFEELLPHISSMTREVRKRGASLMLVPAEEGMKAVRQLVGESVVDAVALFDIGHNDRRLPELAELDVPAVLVGTPGDSHGLISVDVDYPAVIDLAAAELAKSGVKKAVLVSEPLADEEGRYTWAIGNTESLWREAARSHGLELEIFNPASDAFSGVQPLGNRMREWHGNERIGLVVRRPRTTEWVLQLMLREGLAPGRDVALVSVCEDSFAASCGIPVTNVSPEAEQVSAKAIERLFDLMDGKPSGALHQLVMPKSTVRSTTPAIPS